jgi:DNA-binding CsgD family transcriptional regulator
MALVLEQFAALVAARAAPARAIRLAAAAAGLHDRIGIPLTPAARVRLDSALLPAWQALGRRAGMEAWEAGRALSLDEAIAEALSPDAAAERVARTRGGAPAPALTRREEAVAALIARGLTNRQIATELFITAGTAANHVVHILNKLGYSSRSQIAAWASAHGVSAHE